MVESLEGRMLLSRYGEAFEIASTPAIEGYVRAAVVEAAVDYAPDGSTVVAYRVGGFDAGVYVQRYSASGDAIGSRIEVAATGRGELAIATTADGSFVVVYSDGSGLVVARYGSDGSPLGVPFGAASSDGGDGRRTVADVGPDGTITVAWQTYSYSDNMGYYTLSARQFRPDGVALGPAIALATVSSDFWYRVVTTTEGNTLIVWSAGWQEIQARMLNRAGVAGPTMSLGATGYLQDAAADHTGGFAIAWETVNSDGLHVQQYNAAGLPLRPEPLTFGDSGAVAGALRFSNDGGLAVGWTYGTNSGWTTSVSRLDSAGQTIGTAFRLGARGSQWIAPRFAVDSDGELFAVCEGSDGADRYWLTGTRFGPGTSLRAIPGQYTIPEGGQVALAGNADFVSGQTITAWEWDLDYDGSSFEVDRTGVQPIFSAQSIDGPATVTVGLRVRADDGSISNIATTTLTITNVAPTAPFSAGGAVEPWSAGTVSFSNATDASLADRNAGFTYSYDFNNDGTYEVSGSRSSTAMVPASYLPGIGKYTVRGRITDKNAGSRIYTAQVTVADIVQQAFSVAEGGQVTLSANGDFMPGQTITAWEWDYSYDGNTFTADATGRQPIFSAANIDGPATANVAVRAKNSSTILAFATTTLSVTNVAPTATFAPGGQVEPGSAGTVSFSNATDTSTADRNAGFTYSYDFNNDGTFEITSSRASSVTVPASYLANPGSHTLRGRITDKNGGSRTYTTTLRVAPIPPTALFSTGGSVALGSSALLSFTQIQDSPRDVAAGFTYGYDLNNDGVYEITSGSPVCEVPASSIAAPATYKFLGRITDQLGAYSEYSTELRVTIPPDYFPTTAGLTWQYAGTEDGEPWSGSVKSLYDTYESENCFVLKTRVPADGEIHRDFYRLQGENIGLIHTMGTYPSSTGQATVTSPTMSGVFAHPDGWNMSWRGVKYNGSWQGSWRLTYEATFDTTERSSLAPLQLGNGIRFNQVLMVEYVETGNAAFFYPDYTSYERTTAVTRSWYVRGLGLVKEEYTEQTNWRESTGDSGVESEHNVHELSSIPDWAKYTTLTSGILQINGTGISDDIRFEAGATELTVYRNGLPETVPYAGLTGIVINGLDGDDRIDLSALSFPATITGGAGNDTITGGTGADLIYGGDGDDVLSGGAGSDTIYGNFGNDVIAGGLQRDSIMGGWGNDTITAGEGPDSVYGGDGRDLIRGGKGADYIEGKGKSDTIYGGVGNDTIHGNAGDDLIYAEDGDDRVYVNDGESLVFRDTVYAGAGADVIDCDAMDSVIDDEVEVLG